MARKRTPQQGKLRTREHVIADLAVNHVERQVLLAGFTLERYVRDYGIDLALITYSSTGEVENGLVLIQVKATERARVLNSRNAVSFRIERAHLVHWLGELLPVILVVYDAGADCAYWIHVQGYFQALAGFNLFRAGQTVTVHVPVTQVLNPAAVFQFAALRDAVYGHFPTT